MRILMSEALPFHADIRVGSHELADCFMQDTHDIFWVGCTYHFLGVLRGFLGSQRHVYATRAFTHGVQNIGEGSWTLDPATALPCRNRVLLRSHIVLKYSLRFAMPSVRRALINTGFRQPEVLWLSQSPNSMALLDMVTPQKVAYRMSDLYSGFSGVPPSVLQAEALLLRRADAVFVTAQQLLGRLPSDVRSKAYYLPNGVDYDHFAGTVPDTEPQDLRLIPRPRALFTGTMGEWFDTPLMAHAAKSLPDVSFVLIGPVKTDTSALAEQPNVFTLGLRPYATLPAYMHFSDVGLMPFVTSERIDHISSNKLYQYFASGLPVVSSPSAEVTALASPAYISHDYDDFVYLIRHALDKQVDIETLKNFAQSNTWVHRYATIKAKLGM